MKFKLDHKGSVLSFWAARFPAVDIDLAIQNWAFGDGGSNLYSQSAFPVPNLINIL